jgi:membrane protein
MKALKAFVSSIWKKSNEDMLLTHSASLTYYSFIYFIPIFALVYFFFDYFNGFEKIATSIQSLLTAYLVPQVADTISSYVMTIQENISAKKLGLFGVIGLTISSCLMLYQIEFSFNSMLHSQHAHTKAKRIIKYILLMSGGPIFIGLSILAQQTVYKMSSGHADMTFLSILVSVLPLITTVLFITVLYKWVSSTKLSWLTCFKAAIFAGIGIEVLKQLYASYVVYALKGSVYGKMAVLPLFLVWINGIWTIILIGGQICYQLNKNKEEA